MSLKRIVTLIFTINCLFLAVLLGVCGCQQAETTPPKTAEVKEVDSWKAVPRERQAFQAFYEKTMKAVWDTVQSEAFEDNFDYDNT